MTVKTPPVPPPPPKEEPDENDEVVIKAKPTLPPAVLKRHRATKETMAKLSADNKKPYANVPPDKD